MATPDISVVVPSFDRAARLDGCLRALEAQTIEPSQYEIIVCDDGSPVPVTDSLAATLETLSGRVHVRVIHQVNAGPASARNRGAAAAAGRFIAFTDDDCRPAPDWLERLLVRFAERPDALLGGGIRPSVESDGYALAMQAIMDFVYADQERRGGIRLFSTSNLAVPARAFERIGGFSTAFRQAAGEDYDLCARWFGAGGEVVYVPDAVVVHDPVLTLRTFWRQHHAYGRGLLRMRQRMRERGIRLARQSLIERLLTGFHLRLIASPLRAQGARGASCAALIALSQAATATGLLYELLRPERFARDAIAAGAEPS